MTTIDWIAFTVFIGFFALVTWLGFIASHWHKGDLDLLHEWGLAGRRFGTLITWFLLGGDLYTAYTFVAIPALVYGAGALGFFGVPYTIVVYPIVFLIFPRLWSVAQQHGYITASDYVQGRYGSKLLALAVAVTGILATMPYIALQLVGIQKVLEVMGITGSGAARDLPLIIAFIILAAYTYTSGLRAPAMIAIVKDIMIYVAIVAAVIVIPAKLGGYGAVFHAIPEKKLILQPAQYAAFSTLAFGSALALFLYPHAITGVLSASSRKVVQRNAALLPAYSFVLGLISLMGFMAVAAGIHVKDAQLVAPLLFKIMFPSWFAGFAYAAIAIGALVPSAVMSIAAANLFTRNIYRAYFRPQATDREESSMAKLVSLFVKAGALVFIVALPLQYAITLQLLGGIWMAQTLPAVLISLYTRWFHRYALLLGWAVGMFVGTYMAWSLHFKGSVYALHVGGAVLPSYAALWALLANLIVAIVLTPILRAAGVAEGADQTKPTDFKAEPAGVTA